MTNPIDKAQPPRPGTAPDELQALLRELFALEGLPPVWHGIAVNPFSFSASMEYRCRDCDENSWAPEELVHNKGCTYFQHMERIARADKIRGRLKDLVGHPTTPNNGETHG